MAITTDAIRAQSESAYNQWCVQWREQAKHHSQFEMKSLDDFQNTGVGKAVLCCANGYSLEENMETIKKYRDNVDILACDKSLGHLMNNGIKPDFVLLCDANVSYEKYMQPWEDQLKDTVLFSNVCANPKWTQPDKWKDMYFFVNEDVLKSEEEFSALSGCQNFMPAATNVSGAMVVFLTRSDNKGRNNFFGYDKILTVGFDYGWRKDGGYYAYDWQGGGSGEGTGKRHYMRHNYCISFDGHLVYTSNNLLFSAKWLDKYIKTFQLPVIQCGKKALLNAAVRRDLESQIKYRYKPEDAGIVQGFTKKLREAEALRKEMLNKINQIGQDHYNNMIRSL